MSFIKLLPNRTKQTGEYTGDKIRVGFPVIKNTQYMSIYIGKDISRKFGFTKNDRVALLVDRYNPYIWYLEKDKAGWKLSEAGKSFKIVVKWEREKPKNWETGTKFVNSIIEAVPETSNIGIKITFPGLTEEHEK